MVKAFDTMIDRNIILPDRDLGSDEGYRTANDGALEIEQALIDTAVYTATKPVGALAFSIPDAFGSGQLLGQELVLNNEFADWDDDPTAPDDWTVSNETSTTNVYKLVVNSLNVGLLFTHTTAPLVAVSQDILEIGKTYFIEIHCYIPNSVGSVTFDYGTAVKSLPDGYSSFTIRPTAFTTFSLFAGITGSVISKISIKEVYPSNYTVGSETVAADGGVVVSDLFGFSISDEANLLYDSITGKSFTVDWFNLAIVIAELDQSGKATGRIK